MALGAQVLASSADWTSSEEKVCTCCTGCIHGLPKPRRGCWGLLSSTASFLHMRLAIVDVLDRVKSSPEAQEALLQLPTLPRLVLLLKVRPQLCCCSISVAPDPLVTPATLCPTARIVQPAQCSAALIERVARRGRPTERFSTGTVWCDACRTWDNMYPTVSPPVPCDFIPNCDIIPSHHTKGLLGCRSFLICRRRRRRCTNICMP